MFPLRDELLRPLLRDEDLEELLLELLALDDELDLFTELLLELRVLVVLVRGLDLVVVLGLVLVVLVLGLVVLVLGLVVVPRTVLLRREVFTFEVGL